MTPLYIRPALVVGLLLPGCLFFPGGSGAGGSESDTADIADSNEEANANGATVGMPEPINDFSGGNNWALLEPGMIEANGASHRRAPMRVMSSGEDAFLEYGQPWAIGHSDTETVVVMAVTNVASGGMCFVRFDDLRYRNGEGGMLEMPFDFGSAFVTGSVGHVGSGTTSTCLAPNETGYFFDFVGAPLDQVASVSFEVRIRPDANDVVGEVIPQGYRAALDGLTITAQATNAAVSVAYAWVITLDPQGEPTDATLVYLVGDEFLQPTETIEFEADLPAYQGSESVLAFIDFTPVEEPGAVLGPDLRRGGVGVESIEAAERGPRPNVGQLTGSSAGPARSCEPRLLHQARSR